jgi:hypothetical protein
MSPANFLAAKQAWKLIARPYIDATIGRPGTISAEEWIAAVDAMTAFFESGDPGVAVAPPLDPRVEMSASVEAIAGIIEPWRDGKALRQRIHAELTRLLESTERLRAVAPPPQEKSK